VKKVENIDKLKESITTHCLSAAEKIRGDDQVTKSVTVFIRTSPFDRHKEYYSNSKTIDLPIATNNSIELISAAIEGLKTIYKYGYFYQKSGITLSQLTDAKNEEFNLLAPLLETKSKVLMKAIDQTNTKYGRNSISIAQAGTGNSWKMRREHFSKIDTASFNNLPMLKI
jgi:DNA polymerase V